MKPEIILKFCVAAILVLIVMAPRASAHTGESYVICNLDPNGDNYLALRACGSAKCELLMKLPNHTGLLAVEPFSGNHWREVTVLGGLQMLPVGPDGWVYDKFLCEVAD